jgi:sugar phosphate isomerase/epimerase
MIKDPRTETLPALLGHLTSSGYEGVEFSADAFAKYFPGDSMAVVAAKARRELEKSGLQAFGATLFVGDEQLRKLHWINGVVDNMKLVQDLGGEFASFQFNIHPEFEATGGAYRDDAEYLAWCADSVTTLRDNAWKLGLNFYLEIHVDRITEDPAALCRILDLASCELNGDLSHYLFRNFTKGKQVDRILGHMGHTHVRMARTYGDLSAEVNDPKADWESKGVTWNLFQFMKRGMKKGLSSRTISGETGPIMDVKNSLTQDASLVPVYRAMARYADACAQGLNIKVDEPADLKPWG